MSKNDRRHNDDEEESRRILERVNQETEPLILRTASRAREHLSARDAKGMDWTERWGRRIGRILSVMFFIGLVIWLVRYFMGWA